MPETQQTNNNQDESGQKKKWRSRAWFWFVLYAVLVLTGLSIGSYYFNTGADRAKFWVEGLLSAAVLSVVIVQVVINQKQWQAMKQTIAEMQISRELDSRAWVSVMGGQIQSFDEVPDMRALVLTVKNTGKTPALNVAIKASIKVVDAPPVYDRPLTRRELPELNPKQPQIPPLVLGPEVEYKLSSGPIRLQQQTIVELMNNRIRLMIYGWVEYDDIHRKRHETVFCSYTALPVSDLISAGGGAD